jgi:hypothetical protein
VQGVCETSSQPGCAISQLWTVRTTCVYARGMALVLAHAGHWLANLVYAGPVIVVVGWLAWTTLRERRREKIASGQPATDE